MHTLKDAVVALAEALGLSLGPAVLLEIDEVLADFDLVDDAVVPGWIPELLRAWAGGHVTDGWVPFELNGMEASDSLQFLREIPQWLPVTVNSDGERWTLSASDLPHEAIIAFEGDVYLVKALGAPEPV